MTSLSLLVCFFLLVSDTDYNGHTIDGEQQQVIVVHLVK